MKNKDIIQESLRVILESKDKKMIVVVIFVGIIFPAVVGLLGFWV